MTESKNERHLAPMQRKKAVVEQLIKGRSDTGEEAVFRNSANLTWHVMGEGFTWETQDETIDLVILKESASKYCFSK